MTRMDRFCRAVALSLWCAAFVITFLAGACLPALLGGGH